VMAVAGARACGRKERTLLRRIMATTTTRVTLRELVVAPVTGATNRSRRVRSTDQWRTISVSRLPSLNAM